MNRIWQLSLALLVGLAVGTVADIAVAQTPPPAAARPVLIRVVKAGPGSQVLVNGVAVTVADGTVLQVQPGDVVTVTGAATLDIGGTLYSPAAATPGSTPSVTLNLSAGTATSAPTFSVAAGAATTTDVQGNTVTITSGQSIPTAPAPAPAGGGGSGGGGTTDGGTKPPPPNPSDDQHIISPSTP